MDRLHVSTRLILTLLLGLCVAGCVLAPRQTFDLKGAGPVQRIAFVEVEEPMMRYLVDEKTHRKGATAAILLLPPVISVAMTGIPIGNATKGLRDAVNGSGAPFGERLAVSLEAKLRAEGYDVIRVPRQSRQGAQFIADYAKLGAQADAYLDVIILEAGYILRGSNNELEPTVRIRARMVAGKNEKQVYSSQFNYGNKASAKKGEVDIPFTERIAFASADTLAADYPRAIRGIEMGIDAIAEHLAADLRMAQ